MTTAMITIEPTADIMDAIEKMRLENVRRLPVVKGKKLAGLLTMRDILQADPNLFECFKVAFIKKK